jgi:hypothetical protein
LPYRQGDSCPRPRPSSSISGAADRYACWPNLAADRVSHCFWEFGLFLISSPKSFVSMKMQLGFFPTFGKKMVNPQSLRFFSIYLTKTFLLHTSI